MFSLHHEKIVDLWSRCDYNICIFDHRIIKSESKGESLMQAVDTYVRARIDTATKVRASKALSSMGLTVSDAIRLLMLRIADERRLPFDIKAPNKETRDAIEELEAGGGGVSLAWKI